MAVELATGYVNLVPSARGFGRQLSKAIAPDLARAGQEGGDQASRGFGSRFMSGVSGLGSRVLSVVGTGLTVGAAALGGVLATSIMGGVNRLLALEDAESSLRNMGLEAAQIDGLMESLNDTLSGTPYALDAGASALARFVSSGVDLDTIPGLLQSVTDAAAFGKADLNEVAGIFNRIATNGKLSALELEMLTDRGIPALTLLADAAGVTEVEFREMISNNEIRSEDFFRLWEQGAQGFGDANIRMAGAAKGAGETTRGAWANMLTSFNRFGAMLAGPIFDQANNFFNAISGWVDDAGASLNEWAASVDWSGLWGDVVTAVKPATTAVRRFGRTLSNIDWSSMLEDVGDVLSPVTEALTSVDWAEVWADVVTAVGQVRDFIADIDFAAIWDGAMDMARPVVDGLTEVITAGVQLGQAVLPPLIEGFRILWPAIQAAAVVLGVIGYIFHRVFVLQLQAAAAIIRAAATAIDWFANHVTLPAMRAVAEVVSWAWNSAIRPVFTVLGEFITRTVIPAMQRLWREAAPVFAGLAEAARIAWGVLHPILAAIASAITDRLAGSFERFRGIAETVWRAISTAIETTWDTMRTTISAFRVSIGGAATFIRSQTDRIRSAFDGVKERISTAFEGVAGVIREPFIAAFEAVKNAWNSTVGGFGFDVPSWVPGVGGNSFAIPKMHSGGVVPGGSADEVLRLLQGGEIVLSRDDVSRLASSIPAPAMAGGDMAPRDSRPNLTVVTQASDTAGVVSELKWQMRRGGL